jgi:DNA/RNA-binding domain of Phe-tRNA-synthetase-like protein
MITASATWRTSFPGTFFGAIVIEGIANTAGNQAFEERKTALEEELRRRHLGKTRKDISREDPFKAYERYFRKFGQGYPVLHQVETVALKGRPLSSPSPLVAAAFLAELGRGLLTAGHDLDSLSLPLTLDVSKGGETYQAMGGKTRNLPKGDQFLSDQKGILSSIIYGPDDRSFITPGTLRALFSVYGVPSVPASQIRDHLEEIGELVAVLSPEAVRKELIILG